MADLAKPDQAHSAAKLADPAVLTRSMADIAERSQRLVAEWLNRQAHDGPEIDPMNVGHAFMEMTTQLMKDPSKLVQAQIGFWQDYMTLWQTTTRRFFGMEGEKPVIEADPKDRRFKDESWKENEVFDFIKQSYLLSARYVQDVVSHVDGLPPKTAQKIDFYARQFVDAMSPSNFLLTNPEVLRKTAETGGENLLRGLNNLLADLERGRGKLTIKMTDMDAFGLGENIGISPGQVVFQNEVMQLIQYSPSTDTVLEAPAADRPAMDQQVLHPRPAAQEQPRALGGEPGPHRVHDLLGQPGREPRRTALRRLHEQGPAGRARRHRAGDRRARGQRDRLLPGRDAAGLHPRLDGGDRRRPHQDRDLLRHHDRLPGSRRAQRLHRRGAVALDGREDGEARLPRRQRDGLDLQHAPGQRPHLVLRGQQLPDGQRARSRSTCCTGTATAPACRRRCTASICATCIRPIACANRAASS